MRRYRFLKKEEIYEDLNRLRDAFLAAKDGNEVEEIINGILSIDEKLKIGRRILVAEYIKSGVGFDQIAKTLKVGKNTITSVIKSLDSHFGLSSEDPSMKQTLRYLKIYGVKI